MDTIEERARKYATQRVGGEYIGGFKGDMWLSLYQTYIEIATEQRKIDIDNACEWLEVHSFEFIELVSLYGVGADCSQIIKQFKKALEE